MCYQQNGKSKSYETRQTNGTIAVAEVVLERDKTLFFAETAAMLSSLGFLQSPPTHPPQRENDGQPHVIASLERSIEKNAAVWQELSKY